MEDDLISFDSDITKRREPDGVAWIDDESFATANEGDYEDATGEEGGSRGFTVFSIDGTIEYESAETFEHWLASAGHYNEGRSENKGVEPGAVVTWVEGNPDSQEAPPGVDEVILVPPGITTYVTVEAPGVGVVCSTLEPGPLLIAASLTVE